MLCSTCKYYSQDGYCGQGRAVERDRPLWGTTPQEPFSCSGYTEEDQAQASSPLDPLVRNTRRLLLNGLPFPIRFYSQNSDYISGSTTRTIAILEGDVGYQILRGTLDGNTLSLIVDTFGLSIVSSNTHGSVPILIRITIRNGNPYNNFSNIDLMPYLWWLDPDVPSYAINLYLEGLMELYHARLPDVLEVVDYPPLNYVAWPKRPPSRMSYTTTIYRLREVYEYLCGKYVEHTRDYPTWSVKKVEYETRRWRELLRSYCNY